MSCCPNLDISDGYHSLLINLAKYIIHISFILYVHYQLKVFDQCFNSYPKVLFL